MRRLGIATAVVVLALVAPASAAGPPAATTGAATNVTSSTATLNGTVNPNGSQTTVFFQYGTSTNYRSGSQPISAGSGTSSRRVTASLSGLSGNTTYHYRIAAFNSKGVTYGHDRTFKTRPVPTTAQIALAPNPTIFGSPFFVFGRLSGPSVGGKPVALQANPWPFTGGFRQVGNTELTKSDGSYSFTFARAAVTTQFRVVEQASPGATSPIATEFVSLDVGSIHLKRFRGHRVGVRGVVHPGVAGATVLIQRYGRGGRLTTIARANTVATSGGRAIFSRRIRVRRTGVYRIVVITPTGAFASGATGPFVIRRR